MYTLTLEKPTEKLSYVFQIGEHVIGRGPELQCTSKKVSRKHALLKVTPSDGVFLESTHNNPCYHQSKDAQNIEIVSFSKTIQLNNGDKIALALDHGWLTVNISNLNVERSLLDIVKNKRESDNNDLTETVEAKKIKLNETETNNGEIAEIAVGVETTEAHVNSEIIQEPTVENSEIKQEPLDESTNEPEPVDTSETNDTAVKDEPDSKNQCATNSNDPSAASSSSTGTTGPATTRRDRCWYGSSCYRKNLTHRSSFSHPNDFDYDSDPNDVRAICCYGVNCYRRNKLHREKYRHPGQDKIPPPPSKTKRKQQKSPKTNETRKRKVKTNAVDYYYDDDDEDDYDLDDPFINDGDDSSDEYVPESSDTESDEEESSQSQNTEEDTKQLVKDARKFTRGK